MEKVSLADGDFSLQNSGERTYLTANYPASARQISKPGDSTNWSRKHWQELLKEAQQFGRDDLLEALEGLMDDAVRKQILHEDSTFNDDADETPDAVHTLRVHHSREKNYVRVTGTNTQKHRKELTELGLRWSPGNQEWRAEFDEELLEAVVKYIAERDTAYDPDEINYRYCANCDRFKPKS